MATRTKNAAAQTARAGEPCPRCKDDSGAKARAWGGPGDDGASGAGGRGWLSAAVSLPGALLPLLPSFTCPACIAAYAGVLSAMGLGFVLRESVLAPLIVVALVFSLWSAARATRSHKNKLPLVITALASLAVILGRLVWDVPAVVYAGGGALLLASFYNLWLKRPQKRTLAQTSASAS